MCTLPLVLGLLLLGASGADVDVISYGIDVRVESARLTETVTLTMEAPDGVREARLALSPTMRVVSCRSDGAEVPFTRAGSEIAVDLDGVDAKDGRIVLAFECEGQPYNKQSNGLVRTVIADDHAHVRSQYEWYPRRRDDLAVYETRLDVPGDWLARTAGKLLGSEEADGRRVFRFEQRTPCIDVGFAAGPYRRVEGQGGEGVALDALVQPGHEESARELLAVAARALELYATGYGPVPGAAYTLVEMPEAFGAGSGYGETGYALIGTGAFQQGAAATWAEDLVAHEVAHTWWGNAMPFSDFANEMLATYATLRYVERFRGEAAARALRGEHVERVLAAAAGAGLVPLGEIRGWGAGLDGAVYRACAYDKGALLLDALEAETSRAKLDAALRELFAERSGVPVGYADVRKALGAARHADLFERWESADVPRLDVEHESSGRGSSFTVKGRVVQSGTKEPVRMSVTLRAVAGAETQDHVVELKKAETSFRFKCPFEPEEIVVDPEHQVLALRAKVDKDALVDALFRVANSPGEADPAVLRAAIAKARKLIAMGDESHYHTALGRCLFRLGELDEAERELETALEGGAGGPFHRAWIHLRLGCIADLRGDRASAEAWYRKVLEASDDHGEQKARAQRFLERPYRGHAQDG